MTLQRIALFCGGVSKRLRTILQYIFFLGLGILFAWLSLKDLDKDKMQQIKAAFRNARHWLIFPVFVILFLSHYVRALRWRLLIEPLGYMPSKTNSFFAVMIGYLVNMGVPRLGEVVKCTVLARSEKIPADKLIGTIILERVIDAITLLIVFGITLAIQPHLYNQILDTFFNPTPEKETGQFSTLLITLFLLGGIILLIGLWMLIRKKTFGDLIALARRIWTSVIQGVSAIRHLRKRKLFVLLTIILWGIYLLGGYMGFLALQETDHYTIREAFTVLSAGSIGMIASPGGIGAYAFLIEKTMQLYGLSYTIALAFGWLLWMAQTTVIVTGGLVSFVAIPYFSKKNNIEKS